MHRTQNSIEDHTLGQRRLSDVGAQQAASPTTSTGSAPARPRPRPSPLFDTAAPQSAQRGFQQHTPPPLQPLPMYATAAASPVATAQPVPRNGSEMTMEYSDVSLQNQRQSENEPSRDAGSRPRFA